MVQAALIDDVTAVAGPFGVNRRDFSGCLATDLGRQLSFAFDATRDLADLENVSIDYDNIGGRRWDTHDGQGCFDLQGVEPRNMFSLMDNCSRGLPAFMQDAATLPSRRVAVFVYSEFGRRLHENEGEGTGPGRGGVAMLLGDSVAGGQVFPHPTNWSGIAGPSDTEDQPVTVDLRVLQADIQTKSMGGSTTQLDAIIPPASEV